VPSRSKMRRSMDELGGAGLPLLDMAGDPRCWLTAWTAVTEPILHHFPLQRIAMNSEKLAGDRLFAAAFFQSALDHPLLHQLDGLLQKNIAIEQMFHQNIEFLFHSFLSA
jgi:hypothetical protein